MRMTATIPEKPMKRKCISFLPLAAAAMLLTGAFALWDVFTGSAVSQKSAAAQRITKNIEDIEPGDLVLARDELTGKLAPKRVLDAYAREVDQLRILHIRTSDGSTEEIRTTDEHPFWIEGRGWVKAGQVAAGQLVVEEIGRAHV